MLATFYGNYEIIKKGTMEWIMKNFSLNLLIHIIIYENTYYEYIYYPQKNIRRKHLKYINLAI